MKRELAVSLGGRLMRCKGTWVGLKLAAISCAIWASIAPGVAVAGATVDAVRTRGELLCGLRGDTIGFAHRETTGRFTGFDVDMCRVIAAALLGDADKVKFVPLEPENRFDALKNGQVDILAAGTTFSLGRDVSFGFDFPAIYFYDTQAFMALRKEGRRSAREMKGATVCVQSKTTSDRHAREWSTINKMDLKFLEFSSLPELRKAFFEKKCDIYTADRSAVYATRLAYAPVPQDYQVFPEAIADEPHSFVVRDVDRRFSEIVRWSFNAIVTADKYDVDDMLKSDNPILRELLGVKPGLGAKLGLDEKWAYSIVKQVGNYSEIYDRNIGSGSALKIPRAYNSQASVGGMLYAFPLR